MRGHTSGDARCRLSPLWHRCWGCPTAWPGLAALGFMRSATAGRAGCDATRAFATKRMRGFAVSPRGQGRAGGLVLVTLAGVVGRALGSRLNQHCPLALPCPGPLPPWPRPPLLVLLSWAGVARGPLRAGRPPPNSTVPPGDAGKGACGACPPLSTPLAAAPLARQVHAPRPRAAVLRAPRRSGWGFWPTAPLEGVPPRALPQRGCGMGAGVKE